MYVKGRVGMNRSGALKPLVCASRKGDSNYHTQYMIVFPPVYFDLGGGGGGRGRGRGRSGEIVFVYVISSSIIISC